MNRIRCEPSLASQARCEVAELSYERLFVDEFERCVRVARRIVGSEGVARDIAAEAFTRAWLHWPSLRYQRPGAWVVKVSANLAIDATRKRLLSFTDSTATTSHEDGVVQRFVLVDALAALTPQQRTVLGLRYVADLPVEQIAQTLNVSVGTIKTHIHRALKRLRQTLERSATDRP
jgi:RNA polymerase sigma-70 factor (ECF subfamily)